MIIGLTVVISFVMELFGFTTKQGRHSSFKQQIYDSKMIEDSSKQVPSFLSENHFSAFKLLTKIPTPENWGLLICS